MSNPLNQAGFFLIQVLFYFVMLLFILRILFKLLHVNPYNPVSIFVFKLTQPVIQPLRSIIPKQGNFDFAALLPLFVLEILKILLTVWVAGGAFANYWPIFIWGLGDILTQLINLYFYAIIVYAILSWVAPHSRNAMVEILDGLCTPILAPIRRVIPLLAGMDLSPLVAIIVLQLMNILLANPLSDMGASYSVGQLIHS
jgi:YggT family protein